jgi:hypothetical protein
MQTTNLKTFKRVSTTTGITEAYENAAAPAIDTAKLAITFIII